MPLFPLDLYIRVTYFFLILFESFDVGDRTTEPQR